MGRTHYPGIPLLGGGPLNRNFGLAQRVVVCLRGAYQKALPIIGAYWGGIAGWYALFADVPLNCLNAFSPASVRTRSRIPA